MARLSSLSAGLSSFAIACLVAGCAGEGAAPNVKDLTISDATVSALTVGKAGLLEGSVTVEDVDGDIDELYAEITVPDGRSQTLAPQKLAGTSGVKSAPVKLVLALQPPAAGEYTLNVWIRDEKDNDSPKATRKFTVK
ncbi:MAG: hypothetical protein JST00_40715 [Deltaproteobacteria bacterium]|nr:hypothetical protein [Deltaproteobacteria bacterium]